MAHPAPRFIRDQVGNAPRKEVATAAMTIISAVQCNYSPGVQAAALAAAFLLMAESSGIPAGDLMAMARNIITDSEGRRPEFKAVEEYIQKEVLHVR